MNSETQLRSSTQAAAGAEVETDRSTSTTQFSQRPPALRLPIDVVPNSRPLSFRWVQVVHTPWGTAEQVCEGPLPPSCEQAIADLVALARSLAAQLSTAQAQLATCTQAKTDSSPSSAQGPIVDTSGGGQDAVDPCALSASEGGRGGSPLNTGQKNPPLNGAGTDDIGASDKSPTDSQKSPPHSGAPSHPKKVR